ncbi:flavin reductase family protein [Lutispora sp.]|uniref:flavin reductase family protein n=1 Tax=Lutispora sp. TaxID=2828727 RepID=UPI002B208AEF|nr:flavin reductase family protein [Lutispora sp.]MEA4964183.1 flavin reductase family protein [Lutispora sp.]
MKKEMNESELFNSVFLLQPSRPILCTTKNDDGTDHIAPFSWINPVSHKPPRVALALMNKPKKQRSLENIERTGEFGVNIPDMSMAEKMVGCSYSTKFGENKFDRSGFTRLPSVIIKAPCIEEGMSSLECKVLNMMDAGDHTLIIADIVYAKYNEDAYSPNLLINTSKFRPIIHVQNFNLEKSQLHIFLSNHSTEIIEVSYPCKEK